DTEVVRALMLNRLSTLATGRTGVRPEVAEAYAGMLNAGITPVVGEYGSLGCSGDLAPLSHCALALMGEGEVRTAGGWKTLADESLNLRRLAVIPVEEPVTAVRVQLREDWGARPTLHLFSFDVG
ncbi:MAG: aromatic amino acid lyase, partial [Clostridiaceae bacterium]|nr:aromatic amino acid lyase [Clostridiaceae bacterium]